MANIKDDRGFNQIYKQSNSTVIRLKRRCDTILSQIDATKPVDMLEIGCGTGTLSYMMSLQKNLNVLGSDICLPFLEEAQEKYKLPNLEYIYLDFNNPEKLNGKEFDYIFGNGILHHLYYNLDSTLVNLRKLLKPGGKLIFFEPNLYNPYVFAIFSFPFLRKITYLEPDEMAFSKPFILEKIKAANYSSSTVEFRDFLLPGIPDIFIKPSIIIGDILEKTPIINKIAQSIFIIASK